jgi:hypothetical protein
MDSIATARDFFINQQGLSPDQADMIVSQGLQAYNQQTQPRSMMQMASGGIARLGYQMGGSPIGIQTMPMDYGASLQVPSQQQPMFTSTGNATSSPLLNYGQTGIGNNAWWWYCKIRLSRRWNDNDTIWSSTRRTYISKIRNFK